MADLLADNPLLLLFLCLAAGSAAGSLRFRGLMLGPAAVLFTALALSAWDARLELPAVVGSLGLALFAYTVGIASGPSFFAALRHHLGAVGAVVLVLGACAGLTTGVGRLLDLDPAVTAGVFAGALTNTPALAAATAEAGGGPGPTVGYSVAYLGGVLIMLAVAAWALRRPAPAADADEVGVAVPLVTTTHTVANDGLPSLGELAATGPGPVVFTRVKHEGSVHVAQRDEHLEPGDLVSAVGRPEDVAAVGAVIGPRADEELPLDRRQLDMRRIALSNRELSGRRIQDLGLERFGAVATRVRRGDVDLMARGDLRVHQGDRIRVVAPRERMSAVSHHLGDSERGPGDLNPIGLFIGLGLGVLLGLVPLPSPAGGTFTLGVAAGPLVVGLILGRRARTGPLVWSLPYTASHLLQQLGILMFLASAGSRAGGELVSAVQTEEGPRIALAGLVVTATLAVFMVLIAKGFRMGGPRLAGVVAGVQTQPAVLAFAQERTHDDQRVAHGYALVFPAAMITKIVLAALLVSL